tara:strand:+ start:1006 stop:1965 length:960 start_codon:yes stop_codon:yes gene_type:complete
MTVRIPVKYDGTNIVEMTTGERTEWYTYIAYLYAKSPTATVSVVSSSGTLTPSGMTDTRMKAGATSTDASSFPSEGTTAEPATVTGTTYDKITGTTYDTSGSANADLGAVGYPLYIDSTDLRVMTQADFVDTFIYATLDEMISGSEGAPTNGTYTIATGGSAASNYTRVSGTAVFIDTRADTDAYTAGGIPETLDQPETVTSYYVDIRSDSRSFPSAALLFAESDGNIIQGPLVADDSTFNAALENDIQFYAAEDDGGHKLSYNINGSGNSRGTAIVDTRLNGSGNYQTRQVGDDYRAQEFPNGSGATIGTWTFKIEHA